VCVCGVQNSSSILSCSVYEVTRLSYRRLGGRRRRRRCPGARRDVPSRRGRQTAGRPAAGRRAGHRSTGGDRTPRTRNTPRDRWRHRQVRAAPGHVVRSRDSSPRISRRTDYAHIFVGLYFFILLAVLDSTCMKIRKSKKKTQTTTSIAWKRNRFLGMTLN